MELMITIKEASDLVGKVPLTVRRVIYKAPENMKSTDDKGRLLIDKRYIVDHFKDNTNEPINDNTTNDKVFDKLTKELDNKQKTIDSLNERLRESFQVIGSQTKDIKGLTFELSEQSKKLLQVQTPINDDKVEKLEETIQQLEDRLNQPATTKKEWSQMEVISVLISAFTLSAILYYLFNY